MAKSIYEIVESGTAEVTHNGAECEVTLPEWWLTFGETALNDSDEEFMANCTTIPVKKLRAMVQAGVAKTLIELRAVARPADYGKADGGGKRELMEPDAKGLLPQDRVDAYEFKPYKKPGAGVKVKDNTIEVLVRTIEAMQGAGLEDDMIVTTLGVSFKLEKIAEAMEVVEGKS